MSLTLCKEIAEFRLNGLTTAPLTPFTDTGEVNLSILEKYAQHIVDYGFRNIFVTGTTGEGNNLSVIERKKVAEAWMSVGRQRFSAIVIQVGAGCLPDSRELAEHAQSIGADAIACVITTYYKPTTLDSYVSYMSSVASAAPHLPFYLYDFAFITGVQFGAVEFFDVATSLIPTLRGVKHTTPSFPSINTLRVRHPSTVQVLHGSDQTYLEALVLGVSDIVAQSFDGHLLTRIKEAFDSNDLETARKEQSRLVELYNLALKNGVDVPVFPKIIMRLLGLDLGQPRLPVAPYSDELLEAVNADLKRIGFFDWATKHQ